MTQSSRRTSAAVLSGAAAGVLIWSTLIERRLFTVRRHTAPVLAEGATPLRVLQLSDLHLAPWQTNKMNWVRSLAELRPDLVVLTGDLMGHIGARPALLHTLEAFAGIPTVFVHGSNDYYGPRMKNPLLYLREPSRVATRARDIDNETLTSGLEAHGFVNLNNSATELTLRGTRVELFGLNDPHIAYDRPDLMREALSTVRAAAAGTSAADAAAAGSAGSTSADADAPGTAPLRLGVVHAPYQAALNALLDESPDVIFAGHTHGGQVRVPGVGALTSNCDLPVGQARGFSVWHDAHHAAYLNVSAGLGNSIYAPVRFACRPEASLITLTPPER